MSVALPAGSVAVLIAVRNGAAWICRAVTSALAEPEVGEVWVIDDGSTDDTLARARSCSPGDKLQLTRLDVNRGPSAARNTALAATTLPYVAILDADDFFLPGRLSRMAQWAVQPFDLLADDMLLVPDALLEADPDGVQARLEALVSTGRGSPTIALSAEAFVRGNLSRPGRHRQELGFLKPIIRRDVLIRTGLRYRENLRLGEDFAFYTELLMAGARMQVTGPAGYVAMERSTSLSSHHGAADHDRLVALDAELALRARDNAALTSAIAEHQRLHAFKADHRHVLDIARTRGKVAALMDLAGRPRSAIPILTAALEARLPWADRPRIEPAEKVRLLIGSELGDIGPALTRPPEVFVDGGGTT